jgi:hypothetical protein
MEKIMPIDIVVNGYFRSGTTFIWDYLKNELERYDYLSFYEPLNPDLAILLRKEIKENKKNKLHNKFVFKDYMKLPEEILLKILRDNPNANNIGIISSELLKLYLDYFHNLEKKVFLQPNRLHFHLDIIFENYTNKVIHIIRHPLDVWLSIEKSAYSLVENKIKLALHKLAKPFKLKDAFEIDKQYQWIVNRLGYPYNLKDSLYLKFFNKFNAFEKFVVVWVISNYYAIKTVEQYGGLVIPYEYILDNPKEFKEKVSEFIGIHLEEIPNVKKGNYFKFDKKSEKKLRKVFRNYKIQDESEYINYYLKTQYKIYYFEVK